MITIENKVKNAGDQLCKWWKHISNTEKGHFDNIAYKQAIRDTLEVLKKHKVIKDYSMINGVTLYKID